MSVRARPLTAAAFAPWGAVIETPGREVRAINAGRCLRHHALAEIEVDAAGRVALSVFESEGVALPHRLELLERHPLGAQAFVPLSGGDWLVIVAPAPEGPVEAFLARPDQGACLARGTWHGVLTPLGGPARFLVADRVGPGDNLEERRLPEPVEILPPLDDAHDRP